MTSRKPIVQVSGDLVELPAGDDAVCAFLAALGQIIDPDANILEIEAATKAARVVFQPRSGGGARELDFTIGHYAAGIPIQQNTSTTAISGSEMITMANVYGGGIGILRKVNVSSCTSAVTGARAGLCSIQFQEAKGVYSMSSNFLQVIPPLLPTGSGFLNSMDYTSLNSRQNLPTMALQRLNNTTPTAPAFNGLLSGVQLSQVLGGASATIGNNIPLTPLFNHKHNGPYVMPPGVGFSVTWSWPAAATSQVVNGVVQLKWDEWQLKTPVEAI